MENLKEIDLNPMYKMLETLDRKLVMAGTKNGIAALTRDDIWKRIYEFAVIASTLDKEDSQSRIDYLNGKNLELDMKVTSLEETVVKLQTELLKHESPIRESSAEESYTTAQEPTSL